MNHEDIKEKKYPYICPHEYAPLGFQVINSLETKIEVIAAVFCIKCSMFRTKILYFDRQKAEKDQEKTT